MPGSRGITSVLLPFLVLVLVLPAFSHAFGAGNIASISKIEGQNWRHGDIEDTLLTILLAKVAGGKKFSKLNVQRVYFGNWLRDYSQAVDVGTVKHVPAEAIRIILWVLGFLSFGYGTREFEVTRDRLGCYRPEEHIDNPKDYADNVDARQFDPRLRGPVNERVELAIDERTGMKMYIAAEDKGITTSAGLIRDLFGRCIYLGRQYARTKNKDDLYEALRLLGTGCHCLEDFSAHSNYVELALRNCGEEGVFPHVGSNAHFRLNGVNHGIWPIVTGTFGGVDFLHSVMGEFSDKMTQSELQQLEGTVQGTQNQGNSKLVKDLISQMPRSVFGGKNQAAKADELEANAATARMNNLNISQRDPTAMMQQLGEISKQIYPIMEFHDEVFQSINSAIEKIPILPGLIEKLTEAINVYVFSLIAPLILPIISQVKDELNTGSSEVIKSSKEKQMIVFRDPNATDPTHSMLSKDHFTNVLNEPAGKIASQVLKWVVPQIMACWDDERLDVNRTLNRIITGVFHHPALRNAGEDGANDCRQLMFKVVEKWWREKTERQKQVLRDQLSRDGVEHGRNHIAGVQDSGHGGCQGLHISQNQGNFGSVSSNPVGSFLGAMGLPDPLAAGGITPSGFQKFGELAGGGLVGGLLGGVGSKLLGKTFGKKQDDVQSYQQQSQHSDGSYTTSYTETAHRPQGYGEPEKYGQAEYQQTTYPGGGYKEDYQRFEQDGHGGSQGYGFQQTEEVRPSHGGGYDQTTEQRYEMPGGQWEARTQQEHVTPGGQHEVYGTEHHGKKLKSKDSDSDSDSGPGSDDDPYGDPDKKERKRLKRERKRKEREERKQRKHEQEQNQYDRPESPHLNPLGASGFYGGQPANPGGNYSGSGTGYGSGFPGGDPYRVPHGGPPPPPPPPEWAGGHPYDQPGNSGSSWYGQSQQPTGYGQQVPSNFDSGGGYGNQGFGGYRNQGPPPGSWGGLQGYGGQGSDDQSGGGGGGGFPGAHGHGAQQHGGYPGASGHGAQGQGGHQGGGWFSS